MLKIVGLGPGQVQCMSAQAVAAVKQAQVIVGYTLYVEQIPQDWFEGKAIIVSPMTKEIERCNLALDAACQGQKVALVCSGDAGIYALASLIFELMESRNLNLEVEVIPGIPALCAAAALLGAPLTQDFACISLSDLLTPWESIAKRIQAALEGDFVVVIYNPKSKKRNWQFDYVLEQASRYGERVIGVVQQAFRPGQQVFCGSLSDFSEHGKELVNMLSLVIIGNSNTRLLQGRMVTSRGYLKKYGRD